MALFCKAELNPPMRFVDWKMGIRMVVGVTSARYDEWGGVCANLHPPFLRPVRGPLVVEAEQKWAVASWGVHCAIV
jgi:hypothetical protein